MPGGQGAGFASFVKRGERDGGEEHGGGQDGVGVFRCDQGWVGNDVLEERTGAGTVVGFGEEVLARVGLKVVEVRGGDGKEGVKKVVMLRRSY